MATPPDYRLATLLKLRERKKEEAERYLATCLSALREEQKRLQEMEEELDRMVARRKAKMREYAEKSMRGEMSAQSVVGANVYIERLKDQEEAQESAIEGQKGVIRQRQDDVDGARSDLVDASQELQALEKHREKWAEKVRKEREAREENRMDELAQAIHRAKDR